jgi:hypothetical protein
MSSCRSPDLDSLLESFVKSMGKAELVLIRGLPGSGKSFKAKNMGGYVHLEADMYMEFSGQYVYDASKVRVAHDWCVASARQSLEQGENVVVSNTFTRIWELQRYVDLGFPVRIIEMTGLWPNIHGVPEDKIELMAAHWEKLPATPLRPRKKTDPITRRPAGESYRTEYRQPMRAELEDRLR